jgi:hypothetical protein
VISRVEMDGQVRMRRRKGRGKGRSEERKKEGRLVDQFDQGNEGR